MRDFTQQGRESVEAGAWSPFRLDGMPGWTDNRVNTDPPDHSTILPIMKKHQIPFIFALFMLFSCNSELRDGKDLETDSSASKNGDAIPHGGKRLPEEIRREADQFVAYRVAAWQGEEARVVEYAFREGEMIKIAIVRYDDGQQIKDFKWKDGTISPTGGYFCHSFTWCDGTSPDDLNLEKQDNGHNRVGDGF